MFVNTSEPRAKSRIVISKPPPSEEKVVNSTSKRERSRNRSKFQFTWPELSGISISDSQAWLTKYFKVIPHLSISLVLYAALGYIFFNVRPATVANWLLFHSYFPVVILFYFATSFLLKFILLGKNSSWVISGWLTLLLFLKLQSFQISLPLVSISGLILMGPVLIWPVLFKK